ncbi:MAG TPA: class I SAM-dependent methyltransferase [Spirochaetota bacterium]|nr:class I SAM-dependent methyltransferase [Spirochaetota bacterium]HPJ39284.1 class I SAM-dependent methyltransferase [Spirochaetota bacterium]HPQ53330.1 class I SAM-dependent methyltransferase [Spirochaetota bacterium]
MNNYITRKTAAVQSSFYLPKLESHGLYSAQSVGWTDYLQVFLFERLSKILSSIDPDKQYTLLDVGCGLGDYLSHLRREGYVNIQYTGIDIVGEMVSSAQKKYPGFEFRRSDFFVDIFSDSYDFVVCSGALNIIVGRSEKDHYAYVKEFIRKMCSISNIACAFNLLSLSGKEYFPDDSRFFYVDQDDIASFCRELCDNVVVDFRVHEYIFTVHMLKENELLRQNYNTHTEVFL